MRNAARFVRWVFGLQAWLCLMVVIAGPFTYRELAHYAEYQPEHFRVSVIFLNIMLVLAAVCGAIFATAWWTLRKGSPFAQAWSLIASIVSLPFLPIGTAAGIAGIIVFSNRGSHQHAADKPQTPRIAGDGTHKILDFMAQGGAIVGTIAGNFAWIKWGEHRGLPVSGLLSFLIQLELATFFCILVHEIGHLLGGWASDMKVRRFEAGPFDWRIRSGKWTFKFDRAKLFRPGGATAMVMTHLKNIRSRQLFMMACGPLGSLVLGCFALLLTLAAPGSFWESTWQFWSLTAIFSLLSFGINLIPIRPEDQYSDGAQIYQIATQGPWADVHIAFGVVASSLVTPLRPRDYDMPTLLRAARFLNTDRQGMLLRLFAYYHYLDIGQIEEALRWFAEAEAIYLRIADQIPAEVHGEFIFGNALYRRDAAAARMWWQRMEAKGVKRFDSDYWRARAALAWIENRTEDARQDWKKAYEVAQSLPQAGSYDFDRELVAALRRAMDSSSPPPLPGPPPLPQPALALAY